MEDDHGGCHRGREEEEEGGEARVLGVRRVDATSPAPLPPPLLPAVRRKGVLRMEA